MNLDILQEQEISEVEELEAKIAPDGGETVLPLPTKHR
jgi:hypothetical protein